LAFFPTFKLITLKHYKYYIPGLILCCLLVSSCEKYLDITPKGKRLLSTVADYDQWLNDETLSYGLQPSTGVFNYFGDNVDVVNIPTPPTLFHELMYTWAPQFSFDINAAPMFWGEHYGRINQFNTVLVGIDEATGGTILKKKNLKAEALLGRALEYFYLVNEYAKPYDSATAAKDPGVPFVTSNDVTSAVPPRSTIAENYKQIIDDLTAAIPDLPADNRANRFRGSIAGAYSVLARVYFYARNYTEAQKNAELALANTQAVMIDFNGVFPATNLLSTHPDVVYGRMVIGQVPATLEFMRTFAGNDLRVRKLYTSTDAYTFTKRGGNTFVPAFVTPVLQWINNGTSVQELKLMAAECAARNNNLPLALQYLDEVQKYRFATATYVKFQSTNQEAVLQEVQKERSHEMPFNGLRWFDMRRLDKENRMGPVNRYNAQGAIVATLAPHSDRYTLQIPVQVMSFNPGMPQNP
jgi:hypothetical protein